MPVAAKVRRVTRHAHQMARSLWNHAVAPRTHIVLVRFVRLHSPHFHRAVETVPHGWCGTRAALGLALLGPTFGHAKNAHATSAPMMMKALAITT